MIVTKNNAICLEEEYFILLLFLLMSQSLEEQEGIYVPKTNYVNL